MAKKYIVVNRNTNQIIGENLDRDEAKECVRLNEEPFVRYLDIFSQPEDWEKHFPPHKPEA